MSLNGLDSPDVNEVYRTALTDGGRWFFLKYSSRDEVELLEKGGGGVAEAQEVVKRYGEESPLYGFILYRRRKILLRYVPDGTSRLLKARGAVHFQSIEDKFTPHDAVFAFATAEELKDSALSHEIALHTAASIRSVSESHLSGITEDEGDTKSEATQKPDITDRPENTAATPSRDDAQTRHEKIAEILSAMRKQEPASQSPPLGSHERKDSDTDKELPPIPQRQVKESTKPQSIYEFESRPSLSSVAGRMSSQSARPSPRDLDWAYDYKTKVKLGPRPSVDHVNRPSTAGGNGVFRPVSTLPAGLRMPSRKLAPSRPQSEQKHALFTSTPAPNLPLPRAPAASQILPQRSRGPSSSEGSPANAAATRARPPAMTPEKKRLMKALEIRNKQLAAQKATRGEEGSAPATEEKDTNMAEEAAVPTASDTSLPSTVKLKENLEQVHNDQVSQTTGLVPKTPPNVDVEPQDSPVSVAEPSDGQSTQASSISEDALINQKAQNDGGAAVHLPDGSAPASDTTIDAASDNFYQKGHEIPLQSPTDRAASLGTAGNDLTTASQSVVEDVQRPLTTILIEQNHSLEMQLAADDARENSGKDQTVHDFVNGADDEGLSSGISGPEKVSGVALLEEVTSAMQPPSTLDINTTSPVDDTQAASQKILEEKENSSSEMLLPIQSPEEPAAPINEPEAANHEDVEATQAPHLKYSEPAALVGLGILRDENPVQSLGHAHDQSELVDDQRESIDVKQHSLTNVGKAQSRDSAESALPLEAPEVASAVLPANDQEVQRNQIPTDPPAQDVSDKNNETQPQLARAASIELRSRRRGVVSPLQRTSSPDPSDDQFLSDESFMEELKTASVQEAKPVSVSKSPIKPVFSRSSSEPKSEKPRPLRSVSSPLAIDNGEDLTPPLPTSSSGRSFSASATNFLNSQPKLVTTNKKIGVSSSISQRIKALESISTRPTSPTLQSTPQTTFISINDRKNSLRSPPGSPEFASDGSRPISANPSPSASPQLTTSRRLESAPKPRPESISVTATIIRDERDRSPDKPNNSSDSYHPELHQSPLVVQHQSMIPPPLSPLHPPRPQFARNASSRSSGSNDASKQLSPKVSRRESFASWRSGSSRNGSDQDLPHSASDKSLNGGPLLDGGKEEKRDSRGRRFLKRMSGITSGSKKPYSGAFSPGPKEAAIAEHTEPVEVPASATIDLGDLNIQFPDTLLWKPRRMIIDEKGALVLSPSSTERNRKIITKQFSLTDFRPPYIPDQDRQELPNSIILDFKNGSTLQCACETRKGQLEAFNSLRQAYSTHV